MGELNYSKYINTVRINDQKKCESKNISTLFIYLYEKCESNIVNKKNLNFERLKNIRIYSQFFLCLLPLFCLVHGLISTRKSYLDGFFGPSCASKEVVTSSLSFVA